ncbi:hypothetical protein H0H92_013865 [Tricholoma furcatifolium]|nr:hypothetical protein H0H92_013865 [Tricholoma furcatifolium]
MDASPVLSAVIKSRSVVEGAVFDRIVYIWLENTNFDDAQSDPNLSALAAKGLTLSTYYAVTHPSQPNYVGVGVYTEPQSVGGEYFGMDSDDTFDIPATVATVVDLLEDKDISWAEYEEGMPFSGFNGSTTNPITGANDYMRKHNPLISYESISGNPDRLANIKNFTLLEQDLAAGPLPQWIFITPNMTNDGHDTDVTFAGNWVNTFLPPLLENPNFNDDRTLVVLTFDEVGSTLHNNVFAIVLGGALPSNLIGTTDSNFYTHYSFLATVEANWNLHTLGRWDLGANVLDFVAAVTGDTVRKTSTLLVFLAASYPGAFNSLITANIPVPNTNYVVNGRTVLPAIVEQWGSQVACTAYDGQLVPPAGLSPPSIPAGC